MVRAASPRLRSTAGDRKYRKLLGMEAVKNRIKKHEGFRNKVYKDTLNKRTIGYGHLCVEDHWVDGWTYSDVELNKVFDKDFDKAKDGASKLYEGCEISDTAKGLIIEMVFQLGPTGVSKFKNMWAALKESPPNYKTASSEMLDSRWAKQTPSRAKELSNTMRGIV
jgi:lysozyme